VIVPHAAPKINVRSTITPIDKGQIALVLLDLDNGQQLWIENMLTIASMIRSIVAVGA